MLTLPHLAVMQRKRLRSSIWVQVCFLTSRSEQVACETTFSEIFWMNRTHWMGALGVWVVAHRHLGVRWRSLLVSFAHGISLAYGRSRFAPLVRWRSRVTFITTGHSNGEASWRSNAKSIFRPARRRIPAGNCENSLHATINAGRKPRNKDIEHGNLPSRH